MHKIDAPNATPENEFTDGDPGAGILATELWAKWFNTMQRELVAIVEAAGIPLSAANDAQVLAAIQAMIGGISEVVTISAGGGFAGSNNVILTRTGKIVTLHTIAALGHASGGSSQAVNSASGSIPVGFRANNNAFGIYYLNATSIRRISYNTQFHNFGVEYYLSSGGVAQYPDTGGPLLLTWSTP